MNEDQDEPKTIDLELNDDTGRFDLSDARSASPDQGGMETLTLLSGGGLTAAFAYIPNAVPAMLGLMPSQPWLVAAGAATGVAATFVLGKKFESGFTPKEIKYSRGGSLIVALAFSFAVMQGAFDSEKPYINQDRFAWRDMAENNIEELKKHWCAADINGNQNPEWDGRNLNCGPRPDPAPLYK